MEANVQLLDIQSKSQLERVIILNLNDHEEN